MKEVAAILLAAGRSKRMGAFKPLLPFGSSTVIASCVENLRSGGVDQLLVVLGHRAAEVEQHLEQSDVSFAVNPNPDSEMGASIACGVSGLAPEARAVIIALSDQPAVPPSVAGTLIARWRAGAKLVKPEYKGRGGHPVLVDLKFREELLTLGAKGGLRAFFEAHAREVDRVPVDSPYVARDLDTWDDYLTLHVEFFGFAPGKPPENRPN